ncbi:type II toxin-antitoxin system RelE/ParE family toxin [Sphingomonas sp. DT-204]|uniref:type II toxin-antitoxin system RelE/ParE family toxin n=1 Tax=Sphingomonas sp. DT-204 TaxID=3396166 RepID=UPI003F192D74
MRRIIWSEPAIRDLAEIRTYIAHDNPLAAAKTAERLLVAASKLEAFPLRGRTIGRGLRQLSTVYPYLIRYRVRPDYVEIMSVRHGARR